MLLIKFLQTFLSHGFLFMRLRSAHNFSRVVLLPTMFHGQDVETKVIGNFISNIFGAYSFFRERCYFRVSRINVKPGPGLAYPSKWRNGRHFICRASFIFLLPWVKIMMLWQGLAMGCRGGNAGSQTNANNRHKCSKKVTY